ncbi:MAG: hypothetical protein Q8O89_03760 [Nanoarchaeota archaeon]|nr:hypothetical protein [Nanoarchaeota archaeon]
MVKMIDDIFADASVSGNMNYDKNDNPESEKQDDCCGGTYQCPVCYTSGNCAKPVNPDKSVYENNPATENPNQGDKSE